MKSRNLALRFLLELCARGAAGYWGFTVQRGLLVRVVLGIGAPLLLAVVWGTLGSPNASVKLAAPWHVLLEVVVFGAGAVALYAAKQPRLAGIYAVVTVLNRVLMYVWGQ